jgi:CMP-2-keto-3-deoxyoctulosonic acid synthetase
MRVIGVIPSRWGSTRFPGKSLYPICGKPLVSVGRRGGAAHDRA